MAYAAAYTRPAADTVNETLNPPDLEVTATGTHADDPDAWAWEGDALTFKKAGRTAYTVKMREGTDSTFQTIRIKPDGATFYSITLEDVTIDASEDYGTPNASAFMLVSTPESGEPNAARVNLTLVGTNSLTGSGTGAGLEVSATAKTGGSNVTVPAKLVIDGKPGENGASGSLTAQGGTNAAGIGGTGINDAHRKHGGEITINGGAVTATAGAGGGAGIGGGGVGDSGDVTITGGTVTATGGDDDENPGSGIGKGHGGSAASGTFTVRGGTTVAKSGTGGEPDASISFSKAYISGGSVNGSFNNVRPKKSGNLNPWQVNVYLNTLTVGGGGEEATNAAIVSGSIDGVHCNQTGVLVDGGSGGHGIRDVKTDADGKVYLWLPATTEAKQVRLTTGGKNYSVTGDRPENDTKTATLTNEGGSVVTIAEIQGITPPAVGEVAATAITPNAQYSGAVTWKPAPQEGRFDYNTGYEAEIILTAKDDYTFEGLPENFFAVEGANRLEYRLDRDKEENNVVLAEFPRTAPDKSALSAAVTTAEAIEYTSQAGDDKWDALQVAIAEGEAALANESANELQVRVARENIDTAITALPDATVTFDANGGEPTTAARTKKLGMHVGELPERPAKVGYTFSGWFTAQTGGEKVTAATTVTADVTYYAQWTANPPPPPSTFTVTFDANGGSAVATRTVATGSPIGKLPQSAKAGYTFSGWFTAQTGGIQIGPDTIVTGNVTYYAQWTPNTYTVNFTVTFDTNGGSAVAPRTVASGSAIGELPQSARTGYTFSGWFTAASGGSRISPYTVVTGDITYWAQWTKNTNTHTYTVTFDANGGSYVAPRTVVQGSAIGKLPGSTRTGYVLKGWYTKKSGGLRLGVDTKVTSDATYYAHWQAKTYKVKLKNGSKTVKTYTRAYGSKLGKLPKPKKKGYTFKGWYTKKKGGARIVQASNVKKNATYHARWARDARVVDASFVRLRHRPSDTSKTIKLVSRGQKLEYISSHGSWRKVRAGKDVGYIYGRYVKIG
jgi:uncharacterized repeat protein (TIGR02543 family)